MTTEQGAKRALAAYFGRRVRLGLEPRAVKRLIVLNVAEISGGKTQRFEADVTVIDELGDVAERAFHLAAAPKSSGGFNVLQEV